MGNSFNKQRSLEEILQSTSDVLFPDELGERKVEVNSKDHDGDTPLHVMIRRKDRYAVRLLMESGADVNAKGDMGETPLHVAVSQEDEQIIEILLKAGAKADLPSEFNRTALEEAVEKGGRIEKLFDRYIRTDLKSSLTRGVRPLPQHRKKKGITI